MVTGNVQSDVLVRNPEKSGNRNIDVDEAPGRLVTGTWRCDHITPVLRPLHWLPVRQRIHFKIAICVFQALTGQAPAYLADDCQLMLDSDPCKLRSSDIRSCVTPRTSTRFGDRSFSAAGSHIWNSLPSRVQKLG